MPTVSVCLATYNRAAYLEEAIQSVLLQEYPDFELIVSDDASTDRTPDIVANIRDHRLIYRRNPTNVGQWPNRARALAMTQGRYVLFLSDDDRMLPGLLTQQAAILNRFRKIGFVAPGYQHIDEFGSPLLTWRKVLGPGAFTIVPGEQMLRFFLFGEKILDHGAVSWIWPSVMIRKSALGEIGGLESGLSHADELIMYKLSMVSDFCQLHDVLFQYRYHPGSVAIRSSAGGSVYDEYYQVVEKALEFQRERGIDLGPNSEKRAWRHFARRMTSANGALTWTGARFDGSYPARAAKVWDIFARCVQLNPRILLSPVAYATLVGSLLLPRSLIMALARTYLKTFVR